MLCNTSITPVAFDCATSPLSICVHTNLAQIESLRIDWQRLFERCGGCCLFLSPVWHLAWWRAFADRATAHVVSLRDERGQLVGIVPLLRFRDTWRGMPVRVLGTYNNEHASRASFLIAPEYTEVAARSIAQHLQDSKWQWDVLNLQQIPADAHWLSRFVLACQSTGLRIFGPTPGVEKCVISTGGSWDDFLARKTRHFKGRLRENMRRIHRAGKVVYRRSNGTPEDFDAFEKLENTSWKSGDAYAKLGSEGWAFQREVAMAGDSGIRCYNLFLEIDGRVVGGLHAVGFGGTMYSMQTLFDESVRDLYPGRVVFTTHVADMFADERTRLLDLNGSSSFCKSWTEQSVEFVNLQVYSNQPYSWFLANLKRTMGRNR